LVHLLHGDDRVFHGFYYKMSALFEHHPEIAAGFCRHVITNEGGEILRYSPEELRVSGVLPDWLSRIGGELPLQPPSMVVRRTAYEQLGGFDTRMISCGEDWEMWVRIAAQYAVGFEPETLAAYRDSGNSLTKRSIRSGQNIRDVRKATEISRRHVRSIALHRKARESWAMWGLQWSWKLFEKRDYFAAIIQLWEALRCSHSPVVLAQSLRLARFVIANSRAKEILFESIPVSFAKTRRAPRREVEHDTRRRQGL
jgi:hypothetical protein